jgi:hypothetical protein
MASTPQGPAMTPAATEQPGAHERPEHWRTAGSDRRAGVLVRCCSWARSLQDELLRRAPTVSFYGGGGNIGGEAVGRCPSRAGVGTSPTTAAAAAVNVVWARATP